MFPIEKLKGQLKGIGGQDYCAYQGVVGAYIYPEFVLYIDQIPKDPYAPPHTGVYRARVPISEAGIARDMTEPPVRRVALRDYLARRFHESCRSHSKGRRGTGNSGLITIDKPGQTILERSSIIVTDEYVEARFFIGLPANERTIDGGLAEMMLFGELPQIIRESLFLGNMNGDELYRHLKTAEDTDHLRNCLESKGLIAFIGDGSSIPRRSGVDDRPLPAGEAVIFRSPDSMRVEFELPNAGRISGMGIGKGVSLIVGGGYHGKSTVLSALELGIYNHVPGDGREMCVSSADSVKIRASSGRFVERVDISPFLSNMPLQRDTTSFSTENASGSTSQASTIIESIEAGATVLLMDEDTCAANFMIRDKRMQELVPKEDEPITSYIDCIRSMYESRGVSTVLVMGGSGDYFDVADIVIQMKEFLPYDVTARAHEVARDFPTGRVQEMSKGFSKIRRRRPKADGISPLNEYGRLRISAPDVDKLVFGKNTVDLSDIEQLVESGQTKAIGLAINSAIPAMDGSRTMEEITGWIMESIRKRGIDVLDGNLTGDIASFRAIELAAALNRMRGLKVSVRRD